MVKVELGSGWFPLPESWADVIASGRYLDLIGILSVTPAMQGRSTLIAQRVLELYGGTRLTQVDIPEQLRISAAMKIKDEVFPVLDFITATVDAAGELCLLTDCPLPEIEHEGITWRGKGAKMEPMTGQEMEECAWAFAEYEKLGDITLLDKVIAMLYNPIGVREYTIEKKQEMLHTLPPLTKMGIKFWYVSCESWWFHTYQELYDSPDGTGTRDSLSVSRLIRAIAGPKRGTVADVRKMDRGEIYFELAELNREYQDLKGNR